MQTANFSVSHWRFSPSRLMGLALGFSLAMLAAAGSARAQETPASDPSQTSSELSQVDLYDEEVLGRLKWEQWDLESSMEGSRRFDIRIGEPDEKVGERIFISIDRPSAEPLSEEELAEGKEVMASLKERDPAQNELTEQRSHRFIRHRLLAASARALSAISGKSTVAMSIVQRIDEVLRAAPIDLTNSTTTGFSFNVAIGAKTGEVLNRPISWLSRGRMHGINLPVITARFATDVVRTTNRDGQPVTYARVLLSGGRITKVKIAAMPGFSMAVSKGRTTMSNSDSLVPFQLDLQKYDTRNVGYVSSHTVTRKGDVVAAQIDTTLFNPLDPISWVGATVALGDAYSEKGGQIAVSVRMPKWAGKLGAKARQAILGGVRGRAQTSAIAESSPLPRLLESERQNSQIRICRDLFAQ